MKKSILIVALIMAAVLGSCSKSDPVSPGGNNTGTGDSYYPTTVGYWWEYNSTLPGYPSSYKVTIDGEEIKSGKTYSVASTTVPNAGKSYFRVDNNVLYSIGPNGYGLDENTEFKQLDFNLAVGDSTVIVGTSPQGYPQRQTTIMMEKGTTYSAANGITYKDVIMLRTNVYFEPSPGFLIFVGSVDYYFAKGIGFISSDAGSKGMVEIKDYNVK